LGVSKKSRLIVDPALVCGEGPGFGLPHGKGLSVMLLFSTYLWSVGVMEYWKNKTHLRYFGTLNSDIGIL
jgi:hypothetical protein